jgi:hypothetical protein
MTPFARLVAGDSDAARAALLEVFKRHGCRAAEAGIALGFNGRRRFDHFVRLLGLQQAVDKLRTEARVRGKGQAVRAQRRRAAEEELVARHTIGRDDLPPAELFDGLGGD